MIPSYGKVNAVGHRYNKNVLDGVVQITEKIDGSQFSFGIINGILCARSRGQQIDLDAPDNLFQKAVDSIKSVEYSLTPRWIYRGEYLSKPKHNTLAYDRVPDRNIVIFDIEHAPYEYISDYYKMLEEAQHCGFEVVPLLYEGEMHSIEDCLHLLEAKPLLGGSMIEGMVIKNYNIATEFGTLCMAKIVAEDFKEKHKVAWKGSNPGNKDIIENLTAIYKTEARWEKAIQHMKESGELLGEPKDIGPLMKAVMQDIYEEESENIKEMLFKWAWKNLSRTLTSGLPEYYKRKLTEEIFEEE